MHLFAGALLLMTTLLTGQERPVATVESKGVLRGDLDAPESWHASQRAELSEKEYQDWLKQTRSDRLAGMIWAAVRRQFCADKDCVPTEAELEAFQEASARRNRQRLTQDAARLQAIERALEGAPAAGERKKLEKEKELLESVLEAFAGLPGDQGRRIAEHWVGPWKFYRALYRTYGGRVIFQQAGPEPLEAMTKLLREHERRGTFAIYDAEMHGKFWAYFTTMGHNYMSDGGKFMETPWWLQPPGQ